MEISKFAKKKKKIKKIDFARFNFANWKVKENARKQKFIDWGPLHFLHFANLAKTREIVFYITEWESFSDNILRLTSSIGNKFFLLEVIHLALVQVFHFPTPSPIESKCTGCG